MGAWRDDTFLFRQVSPQLGEHVNKFKMSLFLQTLTLLHVWRGGTREHGRNLVEPPDCRGS